jgi:hypothetical protein
MNYGEVLTKSWKIIWKFKVLWLFGILATCGTRSGGNSGSGSSTLYEISNPNQYNSGGSFPLFDRFFSEASRILSGIPVWVYILIGVGLFLLSVFLILLGVFGRIGLVRGAWLADDGAEKLNLKTLYRESIPYFWRVLLLLIMLLFVVLIGTVVLIISAFAFGAATLGIGLICLIPFTCLLIPIILIINILIEQSIIAIVGENLGVIDGLKRGWMVIEKHPGPIIIMGLILTTGSAVLSFFISLPALFIFVPIFIGVLSSVQTGLITGLTISLAIFVIYLPVAIFLNGVLQSYMGTAWTLTFRRLTTKPAPAAAIEPPVEIKPEPPAHADQETQIAAIPPSEGM